jgi:hypothetical protein
MKTFRCFIHPRPPLVRAGPTIEWDGHLLATLDGASLPTHVFDCSYDDVAAQWSAIEGFVLEPDGSFAWAGKNAAWRLEGQLTDAGPMLAVVELTGYCSSAQLDQLLPALGWPAAAVVFQLRDAGIFLDEPTFRAVSGER